MATTSAVQPIIANNPSRIRIHRATHRINDLVGTTGLQLAFEVGRVVIEELYDGELSRWRQRGVKEHTLRELAADPNLGISASALYRALAVYELRTRMPEHPLWERLTLCHIRAVLGLPESEQLRLLERADGEQLSTQALEDAAAAVRAQHKSSRGGRPRKPRFARSIEYAERALADEDAVFGDLEALRSMSPEERELLERRLSFVRQRCDELASLLDA